MTESQKRAKRARAKHRRDWHYSCQAIQWWGDETAHATFKYSEHAKRVAWEDSYLEKDWRVSVKLVKR